ncbi:MAG: DUF2815 family protein [Candidatus Hydrogenedentes bacterium]|nr:DUF2815 family protein [Candidatus Hydrogenedentota bacterium]
MAEEKSKRRAIITPPACAMFVYVWEPRESMNEGQPAQYSISLLFKKTEDISALRRAAKAAAVEKFGDKARGLKDPFRDVDELETPVPGYKGGVFITAKSKTRPGIVDADLQAITDPMDFYPGCICRASVTAWPFDKKGSKGVTFLLNNIQKVKDGTRLDGKKSAEEEFDAIGDGDDDNDPLA